MGIRFFHLADVHIGKCYSAHCLNHDHAESRRNETWGTFFRICRRAMEESIDFLMVAGDLFDGHYCSLQDILGVSEMFASMAPMPIYIIAGNHDPLGDKSVYGWVKWPKNVHLFSARDFERKTIQEKGIAIWGRSWDKKEDPDPIALPKADKDWINILLHHGDLNREDSLYANLLSGELETQGYDYVALGHIHRPKVFKSFAGAYSGSPEPLDFGEYGEHGYMDVLLENGNLDIRFVSESSRRFVAVEVEASSSDSLISLASKIRKKTAHMRPERDFFKVIVHGYWQGQFEPASEQLLALLQPEFYDLTIVDRTKADLNIERLAQTHEDSAIGRYIAHLKEIDLEDSVRQDALLLGIEALLKGKNR